MRERCGRTYPFVAKAEDEGVSVARCPRPPIGSVGYSLAPGIGPVGVASGPDIGPVGVSLSPDIGPVVRR